MAQVDKETTFKAFRVLSALLYYTGAQIAEALQRTNFINFPRFWSGLIHQFLCLAKLVRLLLQFASEFLEKQCLFTVAQVVEQS